MSCPEIGRSCAQRGGPSISAIDTALMTAPTTAFATARKSGSFYAGTHHGTRPGRLDAGGDVK